MMYPNDHEGQFEFFQTLVGYEYEFYGVDCNSFCFGIDGSRIAFEAIEDPSDGYRSYLGTIKVDTEGRNFFRTPVARVRLERIEGSTSKDFDDNGHWYGEFDGWQLVDVTDGHVWLLVGTDNVDDYYPGFVFRYEPKPSE